MSEAGSFDGCYGHIVAKANVAVDASNGAFAGHRIVARRGGDGTMCVCAVKEHRKAGQLHRTYLGAATTSAAKMVHCSNSASTQPAPSLNCEPSSPSCRTSTYHTAFVTETSRRAIFCSLPRDLRS